MEVMLGGDIQHPVVDDGILVAGKADVADFAGLLCLLKGFDAPAFGEAAVGILHSQVLVNLHDIDMVRLHVVLTGFRGGRPQFEPGRDCLSPRSDSAS